MIPIHYIDITCIHYSYIIHWKNWKGPCKTISHLISCKLYSVCTRVVPAAKLYHAPHKARITQVVTLDGGRKGGWVGRHRGVPECAAVALHLPGQQLYYGQPFDINTLNYVVYAYFILSQYILIFVFITRMKL